MIRATALSIAESDPSGSVGVLADLRTFAALGAYGTAVLTTLTARGSRGGCATHPVPAAFVDRQLRAVVEDVRVDAVRIGMLATEEVADAVAGVLADCPHDVVVLDHERARADGRRVSDREVAAIRRLMPLTSLVTPNRAEAARLLGAPLAVDVVQMFDQARRLVDAGAPRVLLKGGHLAGTDAVDVLVGPEGEDVIGAPWVDAAETCTSGCVLSAAVAVIRAQKSSWRSSVAEAKQWVSATIRATQAQGRVPPRGHVHAPSGRRATPMPV